MNNSLQDKYDSLLEDIYRDILKEKGFVKRRGRYVRTENGVVNSVEFTRLPNGKDKMAFYFFVETRPERATQLYRENKITGQGYYIRFIPELPRWNKWTGKWRLSKEGVQTLDAMTIQKQTDMAEIKDLVESLLADALCDVMQYRTEEALVAFLNSEQEKWGRELFKDRRKAIFREYFWYGVLGCCECLIMKDLFPLAFLSVIYFMITCNIVSDAWVRRLFLVAVGQLLICIILAYLLTIRVIDSYASGGLAIGLFLSGSCNITYSLYELYARGKKHKR